MKWIVAGAGALALSGMLALSAPAQAQSKQITLCWAAWDPANALVELSKDFTTKTGVQVKFEFVPWPNFADRMLNELNSKGKLCDLMIGDSQWMGGSAENGHYVKLNDFFAKNNIKMEDFLPATVYAYSTWPKGAPNYYSLPAMGDALGWVYRKDWFARADLKAEFKKKYNRELAPPKTWTELKQIAEFFQGREIDGKKVYGAAIFTERGSEGITMGVTAALYSWGFQYDDPKKPYSMNGFVNSKDAVAALEFYKSLYKCCTPPGYTDAYMQEGLDAFKSGQVAMMMNWFAFFPGLLQGRARRRQPHRLLRQPGTESRGVHPRRTGHFGRILFAQPRGRAGIHQVVRAAGRAEEVVVAGRLLLPQGGARRSQLRQDRALQRRLPQGDVGREGLLARAGLCAAAAGDAETRARLRGGRQGHRAAGARRADERLGEGVQGRRQDLRSHRLAPGARTPGRSATASPQRHRETNELLEHRCAPVSRTSACANAAMRPAEREPLCCACVSGLISPSSDERPSSDRHAPGSCRAGHTAGLARAVRGLSDRAIAWMFIAPTIALLLAINIFPLIWTIHLSFTNYRANRLTAPIKDVGTETTTRSSPTSTSGRRCRRPRTSCSGPSCCRR